MFKLDLGRALQVYSDLEALRLSCQQDLKDGQLVLKLSLTEYKEKSKIWRHLGVNLNDSSIIESANQIISWFHKKISTKKENEKYLLEEDARELYILLDRALYLFRTVLTGKNMIGVDARYASYLRPENLFFGEKVDSSFPTARDDIIEAGLCLALGRHTACVMHSMRVAEIGLRALSSSIGLPQLNDWGSYIREIPKKLDELAKTSGKRSEDEAFYSEAATAFDRVKRAHRNPSMHVHSAFTQERAEEIMASVKSLMLHLALRLSVTDLPQDTNLGLPP